MLNKIVLSLVVAAITALLMPSTAGAYGACHVGTTRVGPNGAYHTGTTAVSTPRGTYTDTRTTAIATPNTGYSGGQYHYPPPNYGQVGGTNYSYVR